MKKTSKKNLKKLVPFVTVLCVFAFVTAGCQNMVLAELLRNHRKLPPQPELSGLTIRVEFENTLALSLYPHLTSSTIPATSSQITANPSYIDYVVKVPYGTTSATVTDFIPAGGSFDITFSPQSRTMALPSKKPVTIKVKDSGGASKTYSVYFVVCPEAYYVAAYGDDRNPGDSKERPFKQLKTALDAASNSRVVNKVVVIGTLDKDNAKGIESTSYTFHLKGYGLPGFAKIADDDPAPNNGDIWNKIGSITISGMDGATLIAEKHPETGEGIKGVMLIEDSYLTFENITITGGVCNGVGVSDVGGGMFVLAEDSGSLSIVKLLSGTRVIGNEAKNGGGGICAKAKNGTVKLAIIGAEISDNEVTAGYSSFGGGGLNAHGNGSLTLKIEDTAFAGNKALRNGGGLYTEKSCTINNCLFSANTATTGGGGWHKNGSITVTHNVANVYSNNSPTDHN